MRRVSLLVVLALALAACTPAPGTERVSAGETVDIASAGAQLSFQRAQNGLIRPLGYSPALQAAAEAHAEYLSRTGNFSHDGPSGATPRSRVEGAGYRACLTAENIARGQPDIRSVVATWMGSPGHRANILNAQVSQYGFARAGSVWVLVLARPC
ncbi:CAP domain-containing protein [Roseibacterium sp. SDUM158017]|uniref:CAP domain-containing protein n=1 Tax=Roseicyclus salinarum TaxID=3036773 RepID=UPI0024158210|nr:CAP domain-containing protein [Roseibacterium sp. SDUM158017]MDG4649321.1 CAP domain-containing protein [Roseibacterium sp. SDUM158017]